MSYMYEANGLVVVVTWQVNITTQYKLLLVVFCFNKYTNQTIAAVVCII